MVYLLFALRSRVLVGWMKVRPTYRFRMIPSMHGILSWNAYASAAALAVSGTGTTIVSPLTSWSSISARILPAAARDW